MRACRPTADTLPPARIPERNPAWPGPRTYLNAGDAVARKNEVQLELALMEASTVPPIVPDSGSPFGPKLGRYAP